MSQLRRFWRRFCWWPFLRAWLLGVAGRPGVTWWGRAVRFLASLYTGLTLIYLCMLVSTAPDALFGHCACFVAALYMAVFLYTTIQGLLQWYPPSHYQNKLVGAVTALEQVSFYIFLAVQVGCFCIGCYYFVVPWGAPGTLSILQVGVCTLGCSFWVTLGGAVVLWYAADMLFLLPRGTLTRAGRGLKVRWAFGVCVGLFTSGWGVLNHWWGLLWRGGSAGTEEQVAAWAQYLFVWSQKRAEGDPLPLVAEVCTIAAFNGEMIVSYALWVCCFLFQSVLVLQWLLGVYFWASVLVASCQGPKQRAAAWRAALAWAQLWALQVCLFLLLLVLLGWVWQIPFQGALYRAQALGLLTGIWTWFL